MRKTMTGLAAFVAVMTVSAMPAMACGNPCASSCGGGLLSSLTSSGCGGGYGYGGGYAYGGSYGYGGGYGYTGYQTGYNSGCCNTGYATLPTQYYYVNQGPTYTGPGAYAPYPAYQERQSYSYGYNGGPYANPVNYNYDGGYDTGPQVVRYQPRPRYYHGYRQSFRYGYRPSFRYGYRPTPRPYYGRPAYAPRYHAYTPRPQWHHRPVLRRYN